MMDTSKTRYEDWGRIDYDAALDEFTARIASDDQVPAISRPLSVGCLLTGRCNLNCLFCYGNEESLPKKELCAEEWGEIFAHLKSWGLMRVDLSGGEPMLRRDLPAIVSSAFDVGLNAVLSTNGLVDKRGPDALPRDLRIHVSLDSGFADVHERSRRLKTLQPSDQSFGKTVRFIRKYVGCGHRIRILTCIGHHNREGLFQLGEQIANLDVTEWNISRILRAGRAQQMYTDRWEVDDQAVLEQVNSIRAALPWLTIRYSNRTEQDGYFLLVLPDGTLATQYTDERDKVVLGRALEMSLTDLQQDQRFRMERHGSKWIAATLTLPDGFAPL